MRRGAPSSRPNPQCPETRRRYQELVAIQKEGNDTVIKALQRDPDRE
jgi:hypothetical protein